MAGTGFFLYLCNCFSIKGVETQVSFVSVTLFTRDNAIDYMRPNIQRFILTTIIGGAVVLLPIFILIWLVKLILQFAENILQPLSTIIDPNGRLPEFFIDFMALCIIIGICFVVGIAVRTRGGKSIFRHIEVQWLEKLPAYSTIREIVQQFTGAKQAPFKTVVTVDVFNTGTRMTGFVTDKPENGLYTVFVPTAPNPTNGFIFHVAKEQLEFTNAKTEDAMRVVIGMGVGSSQLINKEVAQSIRESAEETHQESSDIKPDLPDPAIPGE